jgi:hypothetical protein
MKNALADLGASITQIFPAAPARVNRADYCLFVSVTRQLSFEFNQKFKKVIIAIAISLARYSLT